MQRIWKEITTTFLFFVTTNSCLSKVLLVTYVFNQPEFLEIQYKTFKKFLKDDYELIVFNDATDPKLNLAIIDVCKKYNLKNIAIPQEIHDRPYLDRPRTGLFVDNNQPSARNANVVQYSLDMYESEFNKYEIIALIDSDIFLVREFSIKDFLGENDIAAWNKPCCDLGLPCQYLHSEYEGFHFFWIGLIFFNPKTIPNKNALNFNCNVINNAQADAGGYTYFYLQATPEAKIKYFNRLRLIESYCQYCVYRQLPTCGHNTHILQNYGLNTLQIKFAQTMPIIYDTHWNRNIEFFLNGIFLHFRAGSNYLNIPSEYLLKKSKAFNTYIHTILTTYKEGLNDETQ